MRLDAGALEREDRSAWSALADRAAEPNPFLRPEFVLANVTERGAAVELIVVRDEAHWLACLPVRRRPPTMRLPVPHIAALIDEYSLCGTPLLDRDTLQPAADAFIDAVRAERRAGALVLAMFSPDGPVGGALRAAAARRGVRPIVFSDYERAAWHRSPDPDADRGARLKGSDRRILAKRFRQLTADLGGELEVVDRSTEPAAWEAFLGMENSGWKADRGTALGSTAPDAAFFRRMCADMSAAGHFELVSLEIGGRVVAMECHLIDGDALYSFKIAYDADYSRFSPGTQLSFRVIERFHERGLVLANSCAISQNIHMNRLWPDRRRLQTVLFPTTAHSARLLRPALAVRAVAKRVRDDRDRRRSAAKQTKAEDADPAVSDGEPRDQDG